MEILERLKKISLFKHVQDDESLNKIVKIIKAERFSADTCIIKENEEGDIMYILNKGSVKVEKMTLSKDEFTVAILKEDMNVFFGEVALMDNDLRSASVYAVTPVECYIIKKDDFEKFCKDNPKIGYYIVSEIAKMLSSRLRQSQSDKMLLIEALVKEDDVN